MKNLSNEKLVKSLLDVDKKEHTYIAEVLVHLIEIDSRRLYAELGYSSLFSYLISGPLRYSEAKAYRRITASRLMAKYPELLKLYREKQVSLSNIALVAGVITEGNKETVIRGIIGKSKREVEELVASFKPERKPIERIRPIRTVRKKAVAQNSLFTMPITSTFPGEGKLEARYELKFSVTKEVFEKYQEAKRLLSGKHPQVNLEVLFEEVLEAYLDKKSPTRRQARREKRKQAKKATKQSRYIPAETRDKVTIRDGSRCSYVAPNGERCNCTHGLQMDHIDPYGMGGSNELENLRLLCGTHNRLAAEQAYGEDKIKRFLN